MWARAAARGGAIMSDSLLAQFREFAGNDTSLQRTGENLRDLLRLEGIFSQQYRDFDPERFRLKVRTLAAEQLLGFQKIGDAEAVLAHRKLCEELGGIKVSAVWRLKQLVKSVPALRGAALAVKRRLAALRRSCRSRKAAL